MNEREYFQANYGVDNIADAHIQYMLDENSKVNIESLTYTEKEVEELLKTQRGNCYVAILSKTGNEEFAKVANSAPEPSGGKWRKTI